MAVESASRQGQDRAAVLPFHGGHLLVLADGAGGTSGGAEAAEAVIDSARRLDPKTKPDWKDVLRRIDDQLAERSLGETTAVLAYVHDVQVSGSSVGDSEAWSFHDGVSADLTSLQRRKPLLGSGRATPVGFGPVPIGKRLVVASDGLFKYAALGLIARLALLPPREAVAALLSAVRLPSGSLQDDVSVIVVG